MEFISSLSESSKLVTSRYAYKRWSGRNISEMLYLHLLAFRIISSEDETKTKARDYAYWLMRNEGYKKWKTSRSNDLFYLMFALRNDDVELRKDAEEYLKDIKPNWALIDNWLGAVYRDQLISRVYAGRLFIYLDRDFRIRDNSFRAIRRLAQNWNDISIKDKKLAYTRLIQYMKQRCPTSDLLPILKKLSGSLEIKDAITPDVIVEDDGGIGDASVAPVETTTSSNIAPFISSLGGVQRRIPKDKQKKT